MQRPTAVPRMPASASGVSKQRSGPNRSRSPAVARKTPPARPTSSPITTTESSRASSTWKPSSMASTMLSSPIAEDPSQLVEIGAERSGRIHERALEHEPRIGRQLGLGCGDPLAHQLRRLCPDRVGEIVVKDPGSSQVGLVTADAFALLLFLDTLQVDVRT